MTGLLARIAHNGLIRLKRSPLRWRRNRSRIGRLRRRNSLLRGSLRRRLRNIGNSFGHLFGFSRQLLRRRTRSEVKVYNFFFLNNQNDYRKKKLINYKQSKIYRKETNEETKNRKPPSFLLFFFVFFKYGIYNIYKKCFFFFIFLPVSWGSLKPSNQSF